MLTYDVAFYMISYTICNSWVPGQAACFITRRAGQLRTALRCMQMPLQTRFSTTCSAISSPTFPSFRTCTHTGLQLTRTSRSTWPQHILRFLALWLSQRPTFSSSLKRSVPDEQAYAIVGGKAKYVRRCSNQFPVMYSKTFAARKAKAGGRGRK